MKKALKDINGKIFDFCDNKKKNEYIHEYKLSGSIAAILYYFKEGDGLSLEEILELVLDLSGTGKWPMRKL